MASIVDLDWRLGRTSAPALVCLCDVGCLALPLQAHALAPPSTHLPSRISRFKVNHTVQRVVRAIISSSSSKRCFGH
jgi:hypothetical protein